MSALSGKKTKIMIGCVTFETVKVSDPVKFYGCERVHLIHFVKEDHPLSSVFKEFYDVARNQIKCNDKNIVVEEHNENVSDFSKMLSTVLSIIEKEQNAGDCDIYVNISSGSSEYIAAAAIASMMSENTIPFTIGSATYMVDSIEKIKESYYKDGKPVGLTSSTFEPRRFPKYKIDKPKEHLVRALRVLDGELKAKHRTKSSDIVPLLQKNDNIWLWEKCEEKQSMAMRYHREFVEKWESLCWVKKDDLRKKYVLTDEGENIIGTYYLD